MIDFCSVHRPQLALPLHNWEPVALAENYTAMQEAKVLKVVFLGSLHQGCPRVEQRRFTKTCEKRTSSKKANAFGHAVLKVLLEKRNFFTPKALTKCCQHPGRTKPNQTKPSAVNMLCQMCQRKVHFLISWIMCAGVCGTPKIVPSSVLCSESNEAGQVV